MIARDTQAAYIPAPEFSPSELQAMHVYCLKFRDLIRSGGTPTKEQDARFMRYQAVTYKTGVACE